MVLVIIVIDKFTKYLSVNIMLLHCIALTVHYVIMLYAQMVSINLVLAIAKYTLPGALEFYLLICRRLHEASLQDTVHYSNRIS